MGLVGKAVKNIAKSGQGSAGVASSLITAASDTFNNLFSTLLAYEAHTVNESHRDDAVKEVQGMKAAYGNGTSALLMIANDTGYDMRLVENGDFKGHIWQEPLDSRIGPGQTDCALHVHTTGAAVGAAGYAIYRLTLPNKSEFDSLVLWEVPWGANGDPKAYCEVRPVGHWPKKASPKWVYNNILLKKDPKNASGTSYGIDYHCGIGQSSSPIMKLNLAYDDISSPTVVVHENGNDAELDWPVVRGAGTYRIYIDGSGETGDLEQFNVTDHPIVRTNKYTLHDLKPGTTYRAFVLAEGANGITSGPSNTVIWKQGA